MISTYVETFGMNTAMQRFMLYKKAMNVSNLTDAAFAGAELARELVEESMGEPKTGISWPNRDGRMPNTSSSPSETPAEQTGELINSLEVHKLASINPYTGRASLESRHKHALLMEFGFTTSDGGFHIRPWMRRTIDENRDEIQDEMRQVMRGHQAAQRMKLR